MTLSITSDLSVTLTYEIMNREQEPTGAMKKAVRSQFETENKFEEWSEWGKRSNGALMGRS